MKKIKDIKTGTQLLIGFGVILLLMFVLSTIAWQQTDRMAQKIDHIYNHSLAVRRALAWVEQGALNMRIEFRNVLLANSEEGWNKAVRNREIEKDKAFQQFDSLYDRYTGNRADIDSLRVYFLSWNLLQQQIIEKSSIHKIDETLLQRTETGDIALARNRLFSQIRKIDEFSKSRADLFYSESVQFNEELNTQLLIFSMSALALSLLIIIYLSRMFNNPLKEITRAADQYRSGNKSARSNYTSKNLFGKLSETFNEMAGTLETEYLISSRSADLTGIMLSEDDAHSFCHDLLNNLLEHTQSQMGAVYLLNDEKTQFERFACIGMDTGGCKPFSAIHPEGEFGLALASKTISHIKNIPLDSQFSFNTVSGNFKPREIITFPIFNNNEAVAVISIFSINCYSEISTRLVGNIFNTLTARMNGILAYKQILEFSKKLEEQNIELDTQKKELITLSDELKEQNVELEVQKQQLGEVSRLKTNFLSSMSHELRTPLNSVIALSGVLNRRLAKKIGEEEYSYLGVIERNGKHLLDLINDILDLSRIESGKVEVEKNSFKINALVSEVIAMIKPQADQKSIGLNFTGKKNDLTIESDYNKCFHIFQNIIGNAVKFTEKGSVDITISTKNGSAVVQISDTGIGISKDDIPHIFDEFRQADGSNSRKYGGTGLGLSIAKRYSELIGCEISVKSEPGKGTVFTVCIPVKAKYSEKELVSIPAEIIRKLPQDIIKPTGDGETILLVEDTEAMIIQIRDILEGEGYSVVSAKNGFEALDYMEKNIPDAVILDLMMPVMDGFEVCKILREDENLHDIPVVFVTALKEKSESKVRALEVGAEGFLTKPVDENELVAHIKAMLRIKEACDFKKSEKQRLEEMVAERTKDLMEELRVNREMSNKLSESEERFRVAQEMSPDGFTILHPLRNEKGEVVDFTWVYQNQVVARTNGTDPKDVIGKRLLDLFPTHRGTAVFEAYLHVANTGTTRVLEEVYVGMIVTVPTWLRLVVVSIGEDIAILSQDITEHKRAEDAVKKSEEYYRYIVDATKAVLYHLKYTTMKYEYIDTAIEKLTGYTTEEINEIGFNNIVVKINKYHVEKVNIDLAVTERKQGRTLEWQADYKIKAKDGRLIWLSDYSVPWKDDAGNLIGSIGILSDITERKQAEEMLHESETKFRNLFYNHAAVKLIIDSENGNIVEANEAAAAFYGYTVETLKKMRIFEINTLPEKELLKEIENVKNKKKNYFEFKHRKADGSVVDVEVFSSAIKIGDKEFLHSIIHDISEKKKAEEQLKLFNRAVESSNVSVIITDSEGNIIYTNPFFTTLTGYSFEEVVGKNPRILKSGVHPEQFYKDLWDTILSGNDWTGELHNKKKNGELYWEKVNISSIQKKDGVVTNYVAIREDITERKKMLGDLVNAKEKAEEMNRVKSYFFANMSHELRTPFVGIMGYTEILNSEIENEDHKKMLEGISDSSKRMLGTVNNILTLTKIEFDGIVLNYKPVNLKNILDSLSDEYLIQTAAKGLRLIVNNQIEKLIFNTDKHVFREILSNLLRNAVKFTETGTIEIQSELESKDEQKYLVIKVTDTGIGIPEDKQSIIFDEFRQVSEGISRLFEGTGLGLSIVKKDIDKLGGTITVNSEEGKGSTFTVRLPVEVYESSDVAEYDLSRIKSSKIEKENLARKNLLYIEDDSTSQDVVKRALSDKFDLNVVSNSEDALEMLNKKNYDAFLIDINLGKEDGLQVVDKINAISKYADTPKVAVTAFASEDDKKEFLSNGFTHYISKPFCINDLRELLGKIFSI